MIGSVFSSAIVGIESFAIRVEVDISRGLRECHVVGLPDGAIRESVKRVQSAIKNSGFQWPRGRVTINLSPAGVRKDGTGFDLPIALAILSASSQAPSIDSGIFEKIHFVGELSLDGSVLPIPGVLPRTTLARDSSLDAIVVPRDNIKESAVVPQIRTVAVSNLRETIDWLLEGANGSLGAPEGESEPDSALQVEPTLDEVNEGTRHRVDMSEVKGQPIAKRAIEIAAAGGHNLLMVGPPGTGKTMLARRLVTILPPMSYEESIETTKVYSVSSALPEGCSLLTQRPFCAPHFTISSVGITGGGHGVPRPGQISLAHNGVLFLDELPEFPRHVLEVMRGPLEEGHVTLTRAMITVTYPASFMLVAAMNPCPCGYLGTGVQQCECTHMQTRSYRNRISGPLLDRIDLHTNVAAVGYADLVGKGDEESSRDIRARVEAARRIQVTRFDGAPLHCNAEMEAKQIKKFCPLDAEGHRLMERCVDVLGMSARGYSRILKVARTLADLEGTAQIGEPHLAEAIGYRQWEGDKPSGAW